MEDLNCKRQGEAYPTIAQTRKYDSALLTASATLSPSGVILSRIPVVSSALINSNGSDVVLLKHSAGVTHVGNLKTFVVTSPKPIDTKVYTKLQTTNASDPMKQ